MTFPAQSLISLRSARTEAICGFLERQAEALEETPWGRRGQRLRASDVFVDLNVLATADEPRQERPPKSANDRPDPANEDRQDFSAGLDEFQRELYEIAGAPQGTARHAGRWSRCFPNTVRGGWAEESVRKSTTLLGAPGSGKTFLTRYWIAQIARRVAAKLRAGKRLPDEADVLCPLWLTASQLAAHGSLAAAVLSAGGSTAPGGLEYAKAVEDWINRAMNRKVIVVDSLDELRDQAARDSCFLHLREITKPSNPPLRILVTCRTLQWPQIEAETRSALRQMTSQPLRLAPLSRREHEGFLDQWFGKNSAQSQKMKESLRAAPALGPALSTPLLTLFASNAFEEGHSPADATPFSLFNFTIRRLMTGKWRQSEATLPPWGEDPTSAALGEALHFLRFVAWRLFQPAPSSNAFTQIEWDAALAEFPNDPVLRTKHIPGSEKGVIFLDALRALGLIVDGGFDSRTGDPVYSFAHRQVLEFLAAAELARRTAPRLGTEEPEWLGEAKRHFWYAPEWRQVLLFLAGVVDVAPLLDALDKERRGLPLAMEISKSGDDLFHSLLHLRLALLAATNQKRGQDELATTDDGLAGEVFQTWKYYRYLDHDLGDQLLRLCACLPNVRSCVRPNLEFYLQKNQDAVDRRSATRALGRLGDPAARPTLELALRDDDRYVSYDAAIALGQLGDPAACQALGFALRNYKFNHFAISRAFVTLGGPAAHLELQEALQDAEPIVRTIAARVLGEMGDPEASREVIEVALKGDDSYDVRAEAADALGELGDPAALPALAAALSEKHPKVRRSAARALGNLGDSTARPALLKALNDKSSDVCEAATIALHKLGDPADRTHLLFAMRDTQFFVSHASRLAYSLRGDIAALSIYKNALRHEYDFVLVAAIEGLAKMGGYPSFCKHLLELLKDEEVEIRYEAAKALGNLGDQSALLPLVAVIRKKYEEEIVRVAAVDSLGKLGNHAAIKMLNSLLKSDLADLRLEAVLALGRLKALNSSPGLQSCLKDKDRPVRRATAYVIGMLGDVTARQNLEVALKAAFATSTAKDYEDYPRSDFGFILEALRKLVHIETKNLPSEERGTRRVRRMNP